MGGTGYQPVPAGYQPAELRSRSPWPRDTFCPRSARRDGQVARSTRGWRRAGFGIRVQMGRGEHLRQLQRITEW